MLVKAMSELVGDEILATDGRCGVLEDFYFDRDCWQLCYLLVAAGATRALVSIACVEAAAPARGRVSLALSSAQLRAGAWPMSEAAQWLDDIRVCSARHTLGWRVLAEDGPAGEICDLLVDRVTWSIDYVVAQTDDAYGRRQLIMPLDWADPLDPPAREVRMRRTRAQLAAAPVLERASSLPARA